MTSVERFELRLALALARTRDELRETMAADEWADWLLFQEQCDMPDGFFVAARLGCIISAIVGGKLEAHEVAPYFLRPERSASPGNLKQAFAFAAEYMKGR